MSKFIWLIGENLGNTFDNNSYYFWNQIVDYDDEIDKYLVLSKNKKSLNFYKNLPQKRKDRIIWKDSLKHFKLFKKADMFFVTLSYRDILPEKILNKKIKLIIKRPLVYLQHGVTAIKKLGYTGTTYYNNLFRFVYYNKEMKEKFQKENDFKSYQLYYGEYFPRYKKFLELYNEKNNTNKKILFFITWREYFGENFETKKFIKKLTRLFENEELKEYINNNNIDFKLCLHQFYDDLKVQKIKDAIKDTNIKLVYPKDLDLMKELATCDLLVTDYSSVGFDCTFLNIPVILFQPDNEEYFKHRASYYSLEEIDKYSIKSIDELVSTIVNEKYGINEFFRSKLPKRINYNYILQGKHIDKMYNYFKKLQINRITILGYNFTGKGGTVSATKAMAEALLEKDYLVELMSLKTTEKNYSLPYGLAVNGFYNRRQNKWINRIKRHLYFNSKYYFKYDINEKLIIPYISKALKKYLENTNSRTLISVRESIHLFIDDFANKNVVNKIYFFHTDSTVLNDYYPNLIDEIKKHELDNVVFVTNKSKEAYKETFGYNNYKNVSVIGNALESSRMIEKKYVRINKKRKDVYAVCLMRMSKDRQNDVDNIINFGKFLVQNKVENIRINVYGLGELSSYLINEILENDLEDVIVYKGVTDNSKKAILLNDCVIDFCNNQSFGMTYIEGLLNGKPVFAKENVGSLEVLKEIPYSYYHSNDELLEKLQNVKKKSVREYKKNYDIINNKYSRDKVSEEVIKLLK